MDNERLIDLMEQLLYRVRAAAEEEARSGTPGMFEEAVDAIDIVERLLEGARAGTFELVSGPSLYDRLGEVWVNAHSSIYELVALIDTDVRRKRVGA